MNEPTWATAEEIDAAIPETEWDAKDEAKAQAIGIAVGEIGRRFFAGEESPEQRPQRQDSLSDQLRDLHRLATRYGMYDAADWLWKRMREHG